jgi:hypothetical protein
MVRVAVVGNELTEVGLMLQLLAPKVVTQLRVTVPVNPSCGVTLIGPVVPVLPAFTLGKAVSSLITNVGFAITLAVNDAAKGVGAPAVLAWSVTE